MKIGIEYGGWGLAALALMYAGLLYLHLRRWVARAKGSRVAVYYKRRPVLEAPFTEWMDWAQSLDEDEAAKGRVVYRGSHVSVMVIARKAMRTGVEVKKS